MAAGEVGDAAVPAGNMSDNVMQGEIVVVFLNEQKGKIKLRSIVDSPFHIRSSTK